MIGPKGPFLLFSSKSAYTGTARSRTSVRTAKINLLIALQEELTVHLG